MITILLVDDQNLVQQGIKSLLDQDLELKVIGTVTDGRSAIEQINRLRPDIVLLDIEMPGMDGITTTKYINYLSPKTKVIILSSHEDKKFVTQALVAGAKGYILKSSLMNDLKQAILAVHNGYSQVESRLLAQVFHPNNIKTKINKSSSQTGEEDNQTKKRDNLLNKKSSNSTIEDLKTTSSGQNPNDIPLETQELKHVNNSSEVSNPFPSILLEQTNTETVETDSLVGGNDVLQSATYSQAVCSTPSDYLSLKQETLDIPRYPGRSLSWENQSDLTPIPEHPLTQYKPAKPNHSKLVTKVLMVLNYVKGLGNEQKKSYFKNKISRFFKSQATKYKPQISKLKLIFSQGKNCFLLLLKRWHSTSWLWNISLVLLGAVIVLILHN